MAGAALSFGGTPPRPAGRAGTIVVPDHFLRRWDPVTIFFDPRGNIAGPAQGGPEDGPARWVRMAPDHPGAFRWLDAHTLQFAPAEPWPPLARFTFTVGGAATTLETLMAPPQRTLPAADAEGLEPVQAITLVFPEPIAPAALKRMLSLELRPLPGMAGAPRGGGGEPARWLSAEDFQIKAQDRSARSDPASYVVTLAQPVPLGTRAVLHFRLALSEGRPESSLDLSFATAEHFRVVSLGCPGSQAPIASAGSRYGREQALRCGRQLAVGFSAPLGEVSPVAARNLLHLDPAVAGLKFNVAGSELQVAGGFDSETLYRVSLAPADIADQKGRRLEIRGQSEVYVSFPPLASFLNWKAGQGIVERFGPQQLPLAGRGDERLDLRIYPIDPLDRSLWPFPERAAAIDEAQRPPGPGEEPAAWNEPRPVPQAEILRHLRVLGSPPVSELIALPLRRTGAGASFGLDLAPYLARIAGAQAPGTYLVGLRRLGKSSRRTFLRLQVTDLSLSVVEEPHAVVFAVTSLASGAPVAGARVRVEGSIEDRGEKPRWATLWEGTSDAAGRVAWQAPGEPDGGRRTFVRRLVVEQGRDVLVLDPGNPPDRYTDGQWRPVHDSWLQWTQGPLSARGPQSETLCHIFTDRPVYRPEETVHIKGYLRTREHGQLTPVTGPGTVLVQGPGELVWRFKTQLTAAGSFYHPFKQQKLPTGVYTAELEDREGEKLGKVSFRMEAYRLPRFEVQLHSPEIVPLDKEFKIELTADYYAGGRVAGRPLAWRVTQFPYAWTPKRQSGFLYSSDGRFARTDHFESTPRLEKQETTDATGAAALVLNPAIEPTAQPRTYVVEATITGADDQTVTATRGIVALPPFVLGLKVPRYLERATRIQPEIVVVGPDDKLQAGREVTVRLLQRQWHSHLQASDFTDGVARYRTDVVDEKRTEVKVKSGAAPVTVDLPIARSGVYIVELEARDRLGRSQVVAVDLYAGGEQAVTWAKPPAGAFTVVADKEKYRPGDTAALILESPFQHARALAVVEAPEGNRYEWIAVEGGAATFKLQLRGTYTPRIPVHFVLERGRLAGTAPQPGAITDLGKPATLAATAWLKVEPVDNQVEVKLGYPAKARPGQRIEVKIELSAPEGPQGAQGPRGPQARPLPGEVTLWLVDQAVLALGKEQRLDPLPDFITPVNSHVALRDSRNLAFGYLPFAEEPGGEVGAAEPGNLLDRATVRRNFKPVPYFNPAIAVGADGVARVTVQLPDDLTNFKLRAKAASGPDRFGFGTGQIAVRLPVIVQPALPRFVRPGDRFKAVAIGRIVEGEGGAGAAEARATGAELAGPARKELQWNAQEPARLEFPVTVPTPPYRKDGKLAYSEVTFRFAVERSSDHATDATENKLPIRDDRRRVTVRLLQDLAAGAALPVPALPEAARPGSVRRALLVSDQPALVRMAAGLDFLLGYPYGCTEQRLSRARAELALRRFRELLHEQGPRAATETAAGAATAASAPTAATEGAEGSEDSERMRKDVNDTLDWLTRVVDPDGLAAYWPGSTGYVSLTAWSVEFLTEAKAAGYRVDEKLWETMTRALERSLRSDFGRFIDGESFDERSWALAALTAAGKPQPAYAAELARKAQFLDLEGISEVLQAFAKAGGEREAGAPAAELLVRRLWDGLVLRLYNGRQIYGGLQDAGNRSRNGLILPSEVRTVAEVTRALARHNGAEPRLKVLIEALTTLGRDDGWGSTNANAAALLALSELLQPPFAGSAPHRLEVRLGGAKNDLELGPKAPVASLVATGEKAGDAGQISVLGAVAGGGPAGAAGGAGAAAGPVVVRLETSYLPAGDGSQVASKSAGFVVTRELGRVRGEDLPLERMAIDEPGKSWRLGVGEVIEEHVRVVNPKDRHYVAIAVPLAAGMEPLNPNLATAPPEARTRGTLTAKASYTAFLDDEVSFFYDTLPKGTYDFYFRTRATVEGSFLQPAARAEMMYDGTVQGNSAGARIEIARQEK
ncbi:MAG TPA: MG2 domain-containing protein [Thermoanaerobaculia bacterium]|nr:MG2 domain-containing protein [Thermoanaerobaculia bacterium]